MRLGRLAPLMLLGALAHCAKPPASVYFASTASQSVPLGNNAAGEACTQTETAPGHYEIFCGTWTQPAATIERGPAADESAFATGVAAGPWRQRIDRTLRCDAPKPVTIQGGSALLLSCQGRQEGFPQTAFAVRLAGRLWFANGVPASAPVMERAIALDAGLASPGNVAALPESPGLQAERLARRVASANDMQAMQDLRRAAVEANLAGEYAAAETAYRSLLEREEKILPKDDPALARGLALEALQISNQGRFAEADALFAQAARLAAGQGGDSLAQATVWHYEGLDRLNQKQPRAALPLLRRAEAAYLSLAPDTAGTSTAGDVLVPPDPTTREAAFGVVETRRGQAVALRMMGQIAQSEAYTRIAETALNAYGLRNLKSAARLSRTEAVALLAAGDKGDALSALRESVRDFARALPATPAYARTELLLAARLEAGQRDAQALATCRSAGAVLQDAQSGVTASDLLPCLELLAPAAIRGDQAAAAEMFRLAEEAQGGTTSQQIALVSARLAENARDPRVAKLIRYRDDANAALAALYAERDQPETSGKSPKPESLDQVIAEAERKRDGLDQALQAASPNYGQLVQSAVSAEDILKALRPHEVFAAIVLAPDQGYNFLFADGRIRVIPVTGGAARTEPLVARIRHSMDEDAAGRPPFDTEAARELYAALFGDAALPADATQLAVAPAGTLLSIPFGLLLTGPADSHDLGAAPFLVRRFAIAHVPSAANFVQLRRTAGTSRAAKPWFGFGDFRPVTLAQALVTYPAAACGNSAAAFADLPPLPGATAELELARTLTGGSATDERLGAAFTAAGVQATSLQEYRILHFATHAILQTDLACQREPALVTSAPPGSRSADGALLTASEIAGLKLDAETVLLSACNSGGPGGSAPGESLSGLARSFFYAGARSLLVTHWDVNDKVTSVLVGATLAYARQDPGAGMAVALALAQRKLLDTARAGNAALADPYFWAPLALIGEGRAGRAARIATAQ